MNDIDKDKPASTEGKTPEGEAQVAKSTAADKADGPAPRKSSIPESATATETPPEKPARSGKLVWFLVLILLLGSGYIAWPVWSPALPEGLRATLAPVMEFGRSFIGEKEAALEKRLIRLERFVADYGAVSDSARVAESKRVAEAIRTQEIRITKLERAFSDYGSAADVARITEAKKFDSDIRKLQEQILASREISALVARLEKLEGRIGATATAAPAHAASPMPDTTGQTEALIAANRQAAERIRALEAGNSDLRSRLEALDTRLAAAESRPAPTATGPGTNNALLLSVGQLREAVRGTASYRRAYDSVAALAKDDAELAKPLAALAAHSDKGVADILALRRLFAETADAVVRSSLASGGDGWIDQTLDRLASMVSIRRVGEDAATKDDVQGLVARAEIQLKAGDVAGAVKMLETLKGKPAEAAAAWLDPARARLAVDGAVDTLMQAALVRIRS